MSPERQRLIRVLFDEYIDMYARRDRRLLHRFSENFSGFAGSSNQLIKSRSEWTDLTLHDFAQVPDRIGIEVVDLFPQELGDDVLAVTAFFHIHLPTPDPLFARETARLVLVFRQEEDDWKIAHSSISIPFGMAQLGQEYPLEGMPGQSRELQALLRERTEALAQANKQLQLLRNIDGLTGIANRRHFDDALAIEWSRAQRTKAPVALLMLDVDFFKHFNDQYGHLAGDTCLQALALTLAQPGSLREGDLVARWGGDGFVVLMPGADVNAASQSARKLHDAIGQLGLLHKGASHAFVTLSVGVASMEPQRDQLSEELVRQANRAMHRAKQRGGNCIEVAEPGA